MVAFLRIAEWGTQDQLLSKPGRQHAQGLTIPLFTEPLVSHLQYLNTLQYCHVFFLLPLSGLSDREDRLVGLVA